MGKIEDPLTILGFAWVDDDTGEINWAMKEDFEGVKPSDRPPNATAVVIEISPTLAWVDKKRQEHEFLGDLQEQMNKFTDDLNKLQKNLRVQGDG